MDFYDNLRNLMGSISPEIRPAFLATLNKLAEAETAYSAGNKDECLNILLSVILTHYLQFISCFAEKAQVPEETVH